LSLVVLFSVLLGTSKKVVGFPGMAPAQTISPAVPVLFYVIFLYFFIYRMCLPGLTVADLFVQVAAAAAAVANVPTRCSFRAKL